MTSVSIAAAARGRPRVTPTGFGLVRASGPIPAAAGQPATAGRAAIGASRTPALPPPPGAVRSGGLHGMVQPRVAREIEHCYSPGPQLWLTFDDGGATAQIERILTVLRRTRVQAIFFPIGSWARGHPSLVAQMKAEGHLLGNHTADHVDLAAVPDARAALEIDQGVASTAPFGPLLRPPYGAGAYTARLDRIAALHGQRLCTWTVDTRDWTGASAKTIIHRVLRGDVMSPKVRAGGVVLMHMNGEHTGAALPRVIAGIRARGLTLHRLL